jgi:chemosensory pili system protein ChpA (sensor histidine kinase/response regulator)
MRVDSTLGLIVAEVERSFERASRALQRHQEGVAAGDVLEEARQAVAQVRGVLTVADVAGAPRLLQEMELLLGERVQDPGALALRMDRVRAAMEAVRRYVSGIAAGVPARPMSLAGPLQDLLAARGSDRPAGLDLLDADLSRPPPPEITTPSASGAAAPDVAALRDLRALFQKGLLEWLRGGASGLRSMGETVSRLQALARDPSPWWIAGAFVDQLESGALPASVHVKRIFAGLDQYLARLAGGSAAQPHSILREMLYFIAQGDATGARVSAVRAHYLESGEPEAARAGAPRPQSADCLRGLEALWERIVAGDDASARAFEARIDEAIVELPEALRPLLRALQPAAAAQAAANGSRPRLALEVASALLIVEEVVRSPQGAAALDAGVAAAGRRVERALHGDDPAPPDDSYLAAAAPMSEAVSGRSLLGSLGSELATALADSEQRLAAFFADGGDLDALEAARRALSEVESVFRVLGDQHAAAAAAYCLDQTARLGSGSAGDPQRAQAGVAAVVSALSFHVEGLGQPGPGLADLLHKAGAPDAVCTAPPALPFAAGEPVNLDLSFVDEPVSPADAPPGPEQPAAGADWDVASDRDLLQVFLEEAASVLAELDAAAGRLRDDAFDDEALASLRRGFHTLKGSGRMVDLRRLADVAYAMEQRLDERLRRPDAADEGLGELLADVLPRVRGWVDVLRECGCARIDGDDLLQRIARAGTAGGEPARAPLVPALAGVPNPAPAIGSDPGPESQTVVVGPVRLSRTLFEIFVGESRRIVQALAADLSALDPVADRAQSHERFRLAHTLCGIAGTTGFTALRELAGALESVLRAMHDGESRPDGADLELFRAVTAALMEMVGAVEARQFPAHRSDLESALRARVPGIQSGAGSDGAGPEDEAAAAGPARRVPAGVSGETGVLEVTPAARAERRRMRIQDDLDAALLPAFLEEAADLVPQIGQALRGWRAEPQQRDRQQALTRLLHTFKGGARMAGAMGLGELTHSMETRIATAARLPLIPDSVFDGLEVSFDRIGVLLERISRPAPSVEPAAAPSEADTAEPTLDRVAGDQTADVAAHSAPAAAAARPLLRVRVELLERLAAEAGELAISRARVDSEVRAIRASMREMASSIARLRSQVREMEIQAESQIQSRQIAAGETDASLDPLEFDRFTRLQELTRLIDESANDVATLHQTIARNVDGCDGALASQARMTRVLQDSLMSVRMVPFSSLNERLYRVARLTTREAGRRASLDIRGSRVELDRGVVDRIAAPLEHLLRNAVVHGIEPAHERRALGKPEAGEIILEVRQEGNEVLVVLQDDGRGLDLERLRARAVEAGLLAAGSHPAPEQIVQLAFAPGVSTAPEVSESAGRGVGLDVVRSEVAAVGGRVDVAFEPQRGTVFTVRLPLTMTVMQALVVRCAGQLFALPAMMVEQVRTLKPQALERVVGSGQVDWQANRYPLHDLRELLEIGTQPRAAQAFTPIALVRGGTQRAAIRVDELVAHEEVVMKDIGGQLAGVTGIVGAAVRGSGELVLILNPVRLAQRQPVMPPQPVPAPVAADAPLATVLVVDDSLTVRKITGRVLARRGYRVIEARDGLEALDRLAVDRPGVVLLDVEMPRMDGFEVLRRMRSDPRWRALPVMMVTSRTADKHRNFAFELGASAFLGKPFEEQELLAQVAELLEGARV